MVGRSLGQSGIIPAGWSTLRQIGASVTAVLAKRGSSSSIHQLPMSASVVAAAAAATAAATAAAATAANVADATAASIVVI